MLPIRKCEYILTTICVVFTTIFLQAQDTTQVVSQYCGAEISNLGQYIYCHNVGAESYKWHIVNTALGIDEEYISSSNYFRFGWLPGAQYDQDYELQVAVKQNNVWWGYGPSCTIGFGPMPETQLQSQYCGDTIETLGALLYGVQVPGANAYEWKVFNDDIGFSETKIVENSLLFRFSYLQDPDFYERYNIVVRARVGGVWGDFGDTCQIQLGESLPTTQIISSQCNTKINSVGEYIYCDPIPGAEEYIWFISNDSLGYYREYHKYALPGTVSTPNYLRFGHLDSFYYGCNYNIQIQARVGNQLTDLGETCQIQVGDQVPKTTVRGDYCDDTLQFIGDYFYLNPVPGAIGHIWEIENLGTGEIVEVEMAHETRFRLSKASNAQYNQTYRVRVKVRLGMNWGEYGPSCLLYTGPHPLTQIQSSQCGAIFNSIGSYVYADVVSGASAYQWHIENPILNIDTVIERSNHVFRFSYLPETIMDQTYTARVRTNVGGNWSDFGNRCEVTFGEGPITQLDSIQSESTLGHITDYLYCEPVNLSEGYRWKIVSEDGSQQYVLESSGNLPYLDLAGLTLSYDTKYLVQIAVKAGGNYKAYGAIHSFYTPQIPLTMIHEDFCETELDSFNQSIYARPVLEVDAYEFLIYNLDGYSNTWIDSSGEFSLSLLGIADYNEEYFVKVRIIIGNQVGAYSDSCLIKTPTEMHYDVTPTKLKTVVSAAMVKYQWKLKEANDCEVKVNRLTGVPSNAAQMPTSMHFTNVGEKHFKDWDLDWYIEGADYSWKVRCSCDQGISNWSDEVFFIYENGAYKSADLSEEEVKDQMYMYPVPANDQFYVHVPSSTNNTFNIQVFNQYGALVYWNETQKTDDALELHIDASSWNKAKGMYHIVLDDGVNRSTRTFFFSE